MSICVLMTLAEQSPPQQVATPAWMQLAIVFTGMIWQSSAYLSHATSRTCVH